MEMRNFLTLAPFVLWMALISVIAIGPEIPWMCRPLFAARVVPPSALELRIEELEKRVAELEKVPRIWGGSIDPGFWQGQSLSCPMHPWGCNQTTPNGNLHISTSGVLLIDMPDRKVGL